MRLVCLFSDRVVWVGLEIWWFMIKLWSCSAIPPVLSTMSHNHHTNNDLS